MANKKLDKQGIIFLAAAALGLVLAIVGFAVPWFTSKMEVLGGSTSETYGLFALDASKDLSDFPLAVVQAFGTVAFIFSLLTCGLVVIEVIGILKPNFILNIAVLGLTAVFAVLAMIFALVFAGQYGSVGGFVASGAFVTNAGSYLLLIGALLTSVPLALMRK